VLGPYTGTTTSSESAWQEFTVVCDPTPLSSTLTLAPTPSEYELITECIFWHNSFEFWFNDQLIAKDPVVLTPQQSVFVYLTWDGVCADNYTIWNATVAKPISSNPEHGTSSLLTADSEISDGPRVFPWCVHFTRTLLLI
jgi:hypothetical protein